MLMRPDVARTVGDLVGRLMAPPYRVHGDALRGELKRRLGLRDHILDVARQCKTADDLAAALQADGTLDKLG